MVTKLETKITCESLDERHGVFVIEPLERGYGTTLGSALRRVLLASIPGAAVTRVRFEGYHHEYETLPGVKESVLEVLLNVKSLALRLEDPEAKHLYLNVDGPKAITARDLETEYGVSVVDPDHYITTLDEDGHLALEMEVEAGYGYQPAERSKKEDSPLGVIALDAIFSPVRKVSFKVDETRVGGRTDFDKLTLDVSTNGGIKPDEALHQSATLLIDQLRQFQQFAAHPFGVQEEQVEVDEKLEMGLRDLGFDTRACNLLENKGITTLGELLKKSREEVKDIHGFGEKSLEKVVQHVQDLGYELPVKVRGG